MFGIDDAIAAGLKVLDKFIPDPAAKAAAEAALRADFMAADRAQMAINQVEAASGSLFVAGWRPATGWLCVLALGWQFLVSPALTWLLAASGANVLPLPMMEDSTMTNLLYALLGIGGLRTIDKATGNATGSIVSGLFKR